MKYKIPLAVPYIDKNDKKGVLNVLNSKTLSLGPKLKLFEKKIAKFVGAKYACAVSSGTAGLHLAVKALNLKGGDEVITSPFSFISSSNCLIYENVKPIFVDIEEETYNINPEKIEAAISKKTKAILVVHIFGQTAEMGKIIRLAKKYKLKIIEDACESLGATYRGKMAGIFGDIGVYAFYPNKQMTTGEGGMIVTNNKRLYQLCVSLRNQGRNNKCDWLIHQRLGYNYRLDEMSASLGITQLEKLQWMINKKKRIVYWYNKELNKIPGILLPKVGQNRTHSWFVYVIRVLNGKRNMLMQELTKNRIQTRPYMPVIHFQPFIKKMFGFKKNDFPIAEKITSESLALPLYIGLTYKQVKLICYIIKNAL